MAEVMFAYNPQHVGDLALSVGDKVEVTRKSDDGWWTGRLRGTVGNFPGGSERAPFSLRGECVASTGYPFCHVRALFGIRRVVWWYTLCVYAAIASIMFKHYSRFPSRLEDTSVAREIFVHSSKDPVVE